MTRKQTVRTVEEIKAQMAGDEDRLGPLVQLAVQEFLEAEMNEALGAGKSERSPGRLGYRSGHYPRKLITRVGTLERRVPQDRQGRFSTEMFSRDQRSEKALVAALVERYGQGVSTRKVKAISEELCGHEFSASVISELNTTLDAELERFARQRLEAEHPYLILDARSEQVREDGDIRSRAVLAASGIDWEGRRRILGVELAGRESVPSGRKFLLGLKARGLHGVRLAISDDHPGLKRAVAEVLPEAAWQRGYVRFLRNALDRPPQSQRRLPDRTPLALRPAGHRRSPPPAPQLARPMGRPTLETPRLGRGTDRGDLDLLPPAPRTPQTPQERPPARTPLARRSNAAPPSAASSRTRRAACDPSAPSAAEQHEQWLWRPSLPRPAAPQRPTQTLPPTRRQNPNKRSPPMNPFC